MHVGWECRVDGACIVMRCPELLVFWSGLGGRGRRSVVKEGRERLFRRSN